MIAEIKVGQNSSMEFHKYWDFNFIGTFRLIEVMEKYECRTLIFSSSATVYGCSKDFLITESAIVNPINPYGHTKAAVENFLKNKKIIIIYFIVKLNHNTHFINYSTIYFKIYYF